MCSAFQTRSRPACSTWTACSRRPPTSTPGRGRRCSTRFLDERGEPPFELPRDYDEFVDGKPRFDGVRSFLQARGIAAREPLVRTPRRRQERPRARRPRAGRRRGLRGLGPLRRGGARRRACDAPSSRRARTPVRCSRPPGSTTSSRRSSTVTPPSARGCRASPPRTCSSRAPARSARAPRDGAVFEDALAGVEAGVPGGFGFVVGVDRSGQADALRAARRRRRRRGPRRAAGAARDRRGRLRGRRRGRCPSAG